MNKGTDQIMTDNKIDLNAEVPLADLKLPARLQESSDAADAFAAGPYDNLLMNVTYDTSKLELPHKVTYDDFMQVELRVGTVVAAEPVPKSKKLLKLTVDFGETPRQVIAGIGQTFQPGMLVGHQYVFVTNMSPREVVKGFWSHGMILASGLDSEHLTLLRPEVTAPNGARFQ